jgi:tetratricopeptide (TPR) repeat protein
MRKTFLITGLLIMVVFCVITLENCQFKNDKFSNITHEENKFVGDAACKNCHATAYNDWLRSDHYKSIQVPTDSTVLGNFSNTVFTTDGITSAFFKQGKKFIINTQGDDGKNHDYEVKYTFGYYPLQQYLIEFPNGKLQATRASWNSKEHKWFHQYANQKIDYRDWLHWTGNAQNWNTMCAECHSTNLKKNYDIESDSYKTTFDVLNVSCEACHDAGKKHIDYINSNEYKAGERFKSAFILLKKNSEQIKEINTCAPCHSVKTNISADSKSSEELLDNYIPVIPNTQRFHADGQVNDEDYTYTSFLQSKMFHRNVKCSNCHQPHSEKLILTGNQLCLQCHAKNYNNPLHHFHKINSAGAECKNCHMPGKFYMGNDFRYDHSFRVPRPDLSVQYNTPNACNNCHTNKSFSWAVAAVNKWYGNKRKYHFAEDLIPGSRVDNGSEQHLIKLLADTSVPNIIKATALNYLGNIQTNTSLNSLLDALNSKDAQVRYEAIKSMAAFPVQQWKNAVLPMLNDKVSAVRIAAADALTVISSEEIPADYFKSYTGAKDELQTFLLYQADFAHGNINIAEHYYKLKDYFNAEKFYKRVLKKDSLSNMVRLNLATIYNEQGKNNEALDMLLNAAKVDSKNAEIFFKTGLLYYELKNKKTAAANFEKAVQLKSANPRLYYNYGLLLQEDGATNVAIKILQTGLLVNKKDESLNYALAYVYLSNNQPEKALPYANVLKEIAPANINYQEIFNILHL